ncbi:putative ABC transport system permease protein [Paenibacillus sp. cl141a]|uniref:ABC transporter permease n=1 Tax=Paenibacillus sp. cl141a TaxID=1761877 RepID=UPI0008B06D9A|nr:ABC transporter permease [Paenibacillus sp. cl141a]SEM31012.1 putative ABC transport system permease protein [Paenibacillus sp. cl141a]
MTFRQFAFRNVLRNKRTYAAYFLSSAFSVMIFFVCALFLFHPSITDEMFYPVVIQAMVGAELIMYVFSFFFVLYSVGAFLKTRKREFGILFMHGMTDRQFNKMVFLENMIIGVSAIATGILFGIITGKLFLMAGSAFLGVPPLPFRLSLRALGLTIASYALLFLIISLCTSWLLRPKALIDLFQSGQRPKTAPRTSPWLSILAAVLLLVSYGLAATTSASTLALRMFPVTLMTMIGTYLIYSQLGVALVRRLKESRRFTWRRTKLISLSSLQYRLKDHAQMFSMVTIVLAVSFCSVGVFASIPVLTKQFNEDFPAAIGYLAKTGDTSEEQHLNEIRQELESRKIPFETLSFRVKYTDAEPASAQAGPSEIPLTLIAFSDYKAAVVMAGLPFDEQPPSGEEALVLIASQNDRAYTRNRDYASYRLRDSGIRLREIGYSDHVGVPEYLLPEMDDDSRFGGLVVSDDIFAAVTVPVRQERYTGFYVDDFTETEGIVPHLAPGGAVRYEMDRSFALAVSGTLFALRDSLYNMLLFAALLVGTVFFIAAGSFLYFRLYADLDFDRRHYATISRLGMTDREFRRIVTGQLSLLFFVPIGLAIVHSIFAFIALQSYFYLSIAAEMGIVLISFLMMQVLYFFFIRSQYLRKLKQTLI